MVFSGGISMRVFKNCLSISLIFFLLITNHYAQAEESMPEGIFITISQSQSLNSAKPQQLNALTTTIQKILLEELQQLPEKAEGFLPNPPIQWSTHAIFHFYQYGISVRSCMENISYLERISLLKCLPNEQENFFDESKSNPFLVEMEILRHYSDGSRIYWLDIRDISLQSKEVPPALLQEWETLHRSVSIGNPELKITLQDKFLITLRKIESNLPPGYKIENDKQNPIIFTKKKLDNGVFQITSLPVTLSAQETAKVKLDSASLVIKTINGKALFLKPQKKISEKIIFEGNIFPNEVELLEKSGYLSLTYFWAGERRYQVIRNINYSIQSEKIVNIEWLTPILYLLGLLAMIILLGFYIKRVIHEKRDRKAIGIKIYTIDTSLINAERYRIKENDKIAFSPATHSEQKCSFLYNLGVEGHYLQLLSARSYRFYYTNQNNPALSREFVLPADIELRAKKGGPIRVSIEVMDASNSFMMKV